MDAQTKQEEPTVQKEGNEKVLNEEEEEEENVE